MGTLAIPAIDWLAIMPVLLTSGLGLLLLGLGLYVDDDETLGWVTLIGLAITGVATALLAGQKTVTFGGTFALDSYAVFFDVLFLFAGVVVVLMSMTYLERTGIPAGDYYYSAFHCKAGGNGLSHIVGASRSEDHRYLAFE